MVEEGSVLLFLLSMPVSEMVRRLGSKGMCELGRQVEFSEGCSCKPLVNRGFCACDLAKGLCPLPNSCAYYQRIDRDLCRSIKPDAGLVAGRAAVDATD